MHEPLAPTAGNALEVAEAVAVLDGGGPPDGGEVDEIVAGEMLARRSHVEKL